MSGVLKKILAVAVVACAAAPGGALAQSSADLVGDWDCQMQLPAGQVERSVSFSGNGTYQATSRIAVEVDAEFLALSFFDTGSWWVENGALIYVTDRIETTAIDTSPAFEQQGPILAREAEARVGNTVTQGIAQFDAQSMTLTDAEGGPNIVCTR